MNIYSYIAANWQSLSGLIIGLLMVTLFICLYTRWKKGSIQWIAKNIFRNQLMSEKSAESLLNVLSGFLFAIGGLWIILALVFLKIL